MATKVYDTTGQPIYGEDPGTRDGSSAFSFTDAVFGTLSQVQLELVDTAAATDGGDLTVALYSSTGSDGSSKPSTLIATLGTISDASLSATPGLVTLTVPAGASLAAGTRYWIQVTGSITSKAELAYEKNGTGTGASSEYAYEGGNTGANSTFGATIASVSVTPTPGPQPAAKVYDTTGQAIYSEDTGIRHGGSSAFSFTDTFAGTLSQVQVDLEDAAAATDGGSVSVALYSSIGSDASSKPGTLIATLGTISDASLSATPGLVTLNAPAGIALTAGTRYWIQITGSSTSQAELPYEKAGAGTGASGEYLYDSGNTGANSTFGATIASVSVTPACYCPGTLILTEHGEVPVERLAEGDRVVTLSGALEPIRWIGRRSYAGRFLMGQAHLHPIRIRAGALADGVPRRDLLVSPRHAMFLDGMLIPAECLVNGVTITRETGLAGVDYLHVELAQHDVLWAEGAPSESFVDDGSRGMFHNAAEYYARHGEQVVPAQYCAPRVEQGLALEATRRRLGERAAQRALAA